MKLRANFTTSNIVFAVNAIFVFISWLVMTSSAVSPTLILGATGMTGRHVVQLLLEQGYPVHVIVRSRERMMECLEPCSAAAKKLLTVSEATFLDLSDEQIQQYVDRVGSVVSCLGHTMSFQGIFGKPRRLVMDSMRKLTAAMEKSLTYQPKKLILMNSNGVIHPAGSDDLRTRTDRFLLFLLRYLIPPHADNEEAATLLYNLPESSNIQWCVVRPTDLIDGPVSDYQLLDKPVGSLFGSPGKATRANVAKCMVDMITNDKLWEQNKFQMPVLHDK
jgi:putative NADH-flavin reductase